MLRYYPIESKRFKKGFIREPNFSSGLTDIVRRRNNIISCLSGDFKKNIKLVFEHKRHDQVHQFFGGLFVINLFILEARPQCFILIKKKKTQVTVCDRFSHVPHFD